MWTSPHIGYQRDTRGRHSSAGGLRKSGGTRDLLHQENASPGGLVALNRGRESEEGEGRTLASPQRWGDENHLTS